MLLWSIRSFWTKSKLAIIHIKSFSHIEGTKIEKNVIIGPYARLREGTVLKENTKIGNFVETKNRILIKIQKLTISYIGDAHW